MKGSMGTSMQSIEYRPRRTGHKCNECVYLEYKGGETPYLCRLKNKGRHYTSKCVCRKFVKKEAKKSNKEKAIERWNRGGL